MSISGKRDARIQISYPDTVGPVCVQEEFGIANFVERIDVLEWLVERLARFVVSTDGHDSWQSFSSEVASCVADSDGFEEWPPGAMEVLELVVSRIDFRGSHESVDDASIGKEE